MEALRIAPAIYYFDMFREFAEEFHLGKKDLLVTNRWIYEPYVVPLGIEINVMFQEDFGSGEPSDEMIDRMAAEMNRFNVERIVAFGGGTILDICKILALDIPPRSVDLFTGAVPPVKLRKLVAVPTTCGTGSEVTNVAIAELKSLHTKKGLAVEETFADAAVLVPESLNGLPDSVFAASSVDALIHASESYLSPKATPFTELYSLKAIEMIMGGYREIVKKGGGREARAPFLKDFAMASNYAGIAFGNAGCGAVHALSYSIGGAFHVPHGEANYQFFTEVFKTYMRKEPQGKISGINRVFAENLECDVDEVYEELDRLLGTLLEKKPLRQYGMTKAQIDEFTKLTVENQQRLLKNNYVFLSDEEIREIFEKLY